MTRGGLNENENLVVNMRTNESATRVVFRLNVVLFEPNNTTFSVIQSE